MENTETANTAAVKEEMVGQEVKADDLTMLSISSDILKKNDEAREAARKVLTPPEGQVLVGLRSFCPIHGDITKASKIIEHTLYMKNTDTGEVIPVSNKDVICLACLSDLWRKKVVANYPKQPNGEPGSIKLAPIFITKEEYQKILEDQKAELEKEAAEAKAAEAKVEAKQQN